MPLQCGRGYFEAQCFLADGARQCVSNCPICSSLPPKNKYFFCYVLYYLVVRIRPIEKKLKNKQIVIFQTIRYMEMVQRGYTLDFSAKRGWGVGKTRPREMMPARAPSGLTFNSDALETCPQPMPSTHTFFPVFFFRARCWG